MKKKVLKLITELEKNQYNRIKKLITDIDLQIMCLGIINQDIEGQIWVDNVSNPQTAMMIDNIYVIYLLGNPNNKKFNKGAGEIIHNYIIPKQLEHKEIHREWIVDYFADEWKAKITKEMKLRNEFEVNLWHYKLKKFQLPNYRELIPPNFELIQVDEEFLTRTYLKNHSSVAYVLKNRWRSKEDFFDRSFIFCLVKDDKDIASFVMGDWSTENYRVIGIETDESYRKQGLATIVTAAAAEYCINRNLDLRWFCSAQNIGSWKTAEKVGFRKIREQTILMGECS